MKSYEREIQSALVKTASAALDAAREECPVRTGRLRDSLTCRCSSNTAEIGTRVEYAAAVELGTDRNAPNPFLSRAAAETKRRAGRIFINEMFGAGK